MRSSALVLCVGGLWLSACGGRAPVRLAGPEDDADGYVLELAEEGPELLLSRRDEPLLRLGPAGLQLGSVDSYDDRLSYDPYWLEEDAGVLQVEPPAGLRWHQPVGATIESDAPGGGGALEVQLDYDEGLRARLSLRREASGRFSAVLRPERGGRPLVFARIRADVDEGEGLYGLGMWADQVHSRGKLRPMQLEVAALESANNENRVPVPLLIGGRGWGLFVDSRRTGAFDVARKDPRAVEATFAAHPLGDEAPELRFHLFAAEHPLDIPRRYYDVTGAPLMPAPWALGPWIWRDENQNKDQVLADIVKIRQLDLATSAIWIDRPYASAVNTFDFDPKRFPEPKEIVDKAHAAGLRVALWSTPYLEKTAEPLRSQALQEGFFPKKSSILTNNWSEPLDLTNPRAYAFWQEQIRKYTKLGIEGFKLDYGEDVVPALGGSRSVWRFADGSDERTMHHGYTLLYHRVYAETLPPPERGGGFLLCRTGRFGDQKNVSVIWPGDMNADFNRYGEPPPKSGPGAKPGVGGLPATVVQGVSLGLVGFPFFGADTGGYRQSPPSRELFIRWFQQTALSSVMQVGDSSSTTPWEYAEREDPQEPVKLLPLYRDFARLHLRLFPYEWTLAQDLQRSGRPLQRPVGLAYPQLGAHPSDEYLFGPDLLVAPVLEAGQRRRAVLLPPGDWIDWWDGTVYQGGADGATVEVPAPLERLPLLLRQGAIVPLLRPDIDTLAPASDPGVQSFADDPGALYARLVPSPGDASSFTLYDGARITQEADGRTLRLRGGAVFRHGFVLEIVRSAAAGGSQWIRVPPSEAEQTVLIP